VENVHQIDEGHVEWAADNQISVVFSPPYKIDYERQIYMGDSGMAEVYRFWFVGRTTYHVQKDLVRANPLSASIGINIRIEAFDRLVGFLEASNNI